MSVIMPVWRPHAAWLEQAVSSVLDEVGCDLELIVVDDGNPAPVADDLAIVHPRLRIIRTPHGGVSRARNAGVAAARGRYLRFVDADDAVEPGSTARLLALASGAGGIISYGATSFCDEQLRSSWVMTADVRGDAAVRCMLGRFPVRLQAMLFPRTVAQAAGPWDPALTVSEDWEWVLRALEHAPVIGDATVVVRYRRAGGGATSDLEAGRQGARVVVQRWFARHPEQRGSPLERRAKGMLAAMAGRVHLSHGEWRQGLVALFRAVALDPGAVGFEVRKSLPAVRSLMTARTQAITGRRPRGPGR